MGSLELLLTPGAAPVTVYRPTDRLLLGTPSWQIPVLSLPEPWPGAHGEGQFLSFWPVQTVSSDYESSIALARFTETRTI